MPIPTRLANDGWWLCESPSIALVRNISLQTGSAKMTSLSTTDSDVRSAQESVFPVKLAIALFLAALADWLFYGERIGISAVVFALAVTCGSLIANFSRLNRNRRCWLALSC
jgi:hypothetical protein